MTIEKKLLGTNPVDGAVTVEDVFSTYLYKGTGAAQTITNGIDLDGEGGMVWLKSRTEGGSKYTGEHHVYDTERGATKALFPNASTSGSDRAQGVKAFNSNGVTIGTNSAINYNNDNFVAWTFRKKEKFFDVVTYSGNGVTGRALSHNLGAAPAMVMIKCISSGGDWLVWHKNGGGGGVTQTTFYLNTTAAGGGTNYIFYGGTGALTDTTFGGLGAYDYSNESGKTYVAYLFADNSSEDADEQMIKCGSYTGNNSTIGPYVSLGWEPQFVLIKSTQGSDAWVMFDSMRGLPEGTGNASSKRILSPNSSGVEGGTNSGISVDPDGFHITGVGGQTNDNNYTYIYMAIRAPMMKEPSAGTEVFKANVVTPSSGVSTITTTFPVDLVLSAQRSKAAYDDTFMFDRMRGKDKKLLTNKTDTEGSTSAYIEFDHNDQLVDRFLAVSTSVVHFLFKRAKGFFDVVAYTGTGANTTQAHSLGVAPELVLIKNRNSTYNWAGWSSSFTNAQWISLDSDSQAFSDVSVWNNTAPTATALSFGNDGKTNRSAYTYIAYLFASLDGVSKVGSYTGNGSSQTINCGFAAGARFVLIKRTDASGDWYIWDTVRGIVAGNDPHLSLNTTAAEVTTDDSIDPHNSGFIVNQVAATNINVSSGTYIYLAIA